MHDSRQFGLPQRSDVRNLDVRRSENPFAQQKIERLSYRFPDGGSWASNLSRLAALNFRAVVVGGYGTGKSTLIRELQHELAGVTTDRPITEPLQRWNPVSQTPSPSTSITHSMLLDVPRAGSRFRRGRNGGVARRQQQAMVADQLLGLNRGTLLLVDGIERLTWLDRQRLVHQTATVSQVAGLIVIVHQPRHWLRLPTWIETQPSAALLNDLINELLSDRTAMERSFFQQRGTELLKQSRNNIRATLRQLYDEWSLVLPI